MTQLASLQVLLLGATAAASFVAALFFLKFWRRTADRFFLLFSVAFFVDAGHRVVLGLIDPNEQGPHVYLGRLLVFFLILTAIFYKNRRR